MNIEKPTYQDLEERIKELEKENQGLRNQLSVSFNEHGKNLIDFINNSPAFIYLLDNQGRFFTLNKSLANFFKKPIDEIIGCKRDSFLPQEIAVKHLNNDRIVIASKKCSLFEEQTIQEDGTHYYLTQKFPLIDKSGNCYGVGGISTEVSELKQLQKSLHKVGNQAVGNEAFLRTFLNTLPDLVWLKDINGVYLKVNKRFEDFFGATDQEIIGKTDYDFINKELADFFRQKDKEAIDAGKPSVNEEFITFANDKHSEYIETIKTPFFIDGVLVGVLGIGRNITDRKNAETELLKEKEKAEENQKKFKAIADTSPLAIYISKGIRQVAEYINPAFQKLFGYSNSEVSEVAKWWPLAYPDPEYQKQVSEKWNKEVEKAIQNKSAIAPMEVVVNCKDGSKKNILWGFVSIGDENWAFGMDLTAYRKTEQELIAAKEKAEDRENYLSVIYENSGLSIFVVNVVDNQTFVYEEINPTHESLMNIKNSEIAGKAPDEMVYHFGQETIDYVKALYSECVQKQETLISEFFIPEGKAKGWWLSRLTPIINEKLGKVIKLIGGSIDISERKNTELELLKAKEMAEENEKKFKNLYESLSIAYLVFKDGVCVECNEASLAIYGVKTKDEILGKSPTEFSPEYQSTNERSEDAAIKNIQIVLEKGYHNFEWKAMKKNKEVFFNEVSLKKIYFKNEMYIQCLTTDITERKRVENELIAAKEKAEESDRLKTAFLNNLSHEIRTPLNAISGFAGLLNDPNLSYEKRKNFVQIIQNSGHQLTSIVNDILIISSLETKQERINISTVCINSIIVELFAIFGQQAKNQNISLYTKQPLNDNQSLIYIDKAKITQILSNLLSNALKFTHEGFIEFGYQLKNDEFEFYVKDTGIGIKPELQSKIFERFRQADLSITKIYGGTGLGLSISKGFVELLGGKIWVSSDVAKGSTFYFTIPYKPENEIVKDVKPLYIADKTSAILIAEDDELNYLYIEELLTGLDVKIIHAKNGRETIELLTANPDISLILMDIKMPIMDGHEAAKIIKQQKPNLPIIAQSAYALAHERAKYEAIFDDYITKPIYADDLKQLVLKYIHV